MRGESTYFGAIKYSIHVGLEPARYTVGGQNNTITTNMYPT